MKNETKKEKSDESIKKRLEEMDDKLERMDNKLERIKSHTNNLSRVACISSSTQIKTEILKAVGKSEVRAAILYLTKDEISAKDLVRELGISSQNLSTYMDPFMGNKGIITELRKGSLKFYQRSDFVDTVGFDKDPNFVGLIQSWETKRKAESSAKPEASKEGANVS